ncbi:MAG: acyl carrier protein [Solirubrobacterales bacterium]
MTHFPDRKPEPGVTNAVRAYIVDNMLLGAAEDLDDGTSLLEAGILDSTGAIELVAFIEETFGIRVAEDELVPENLDSVAAIAAFVERKQGAAR